MHGLRLYQPGFKTGELIVFFFVGGKLAISHQEIHNYALDMLVGMTNEKKNIIISY